MDRFAGNEPRLVISFRLDNELGHPTSGGTEAMELPATYFVSVDYSSSSTSSLSETSGLSVPPPVMSRRETAANLTPEEPPNFSSPVKGTQTSVQTCEVPLSTTQGTVTAIISAVVGH